MAASSSHTSLRGIAYVVLAVALITINDTVMKAMTAGYPVGEIMFLRGIFMFIPITVLAWRAGGFPALRVRNVPVQIFRGLLAIGSTYLFVSALGDMQLADAVAITLAMPLFVTALAGPLLGERVGWRRWSAVFVGFAGVLVMFRPTGDALRLIAFLPLAAAFSEAVRDIVTRRLAAREKTVATLAFTTGIVVLGGLASAPLGWIAPAWADVGLIAGAGILTGGGHFLLIEALRLAEASAIAPYRYSIVVWSVLAGYLIWGDLPDLWIVTGIALVIGSGLYILHRETRLMRFGRGR